MAGWCSNGSTILSLLHDKKHEFYFWFLVVLGFGNFFFETLFRFGLSFDCKSLNFMQYMVSMRKVSILPFLNTSLNMSRINQEKLSFENKTGLING